MTDQQFDEFRDYVSFACRGPRDEKNYPMMSGFLLGTLNDLVVKFPGVGEHLMSIMQHDQQYQQHQQAAVE